jgi:hypothetical protein
VVGWINELEYWLSERLCAAEQDFGRDAVFKYLRRFWCKHDRTVRSCSLLVPP